MEKECCVYCKSSEKVNTNFVGCEHKACDNCVFNIIFHAYLDKIPNGGFIIHECPFCEDCNFKYPIENILKLIESITENELKFDFFCTRHASPTFTYCEECKKFICVRCEKSHKEKGFKHKFKNDFYTKYKLDPNENTSRSIASQAESKIKIHLKSKSFDAYQVHLKKSMNTFQKKIGEATNVIISKVDVMICILNGYKKQLMEDMDQSITRQKQIINIYKLFYSKFYNDIYQAYSSQNYKPLENLLSTVNRQFYSVDVSDINPILQELEGLKEEVESYISSMKKINLRFMFPIIASAYTNTHTLVGHSDMINCVTLLKGGDIASGGRDNIIRIWKKDKNYENTLNLEGHKGWISTLLLLRNGQLISGSYDGTLKIWDNKKNYECINTLEGHTSGVSSTIQFDNGTLISSSFDNNIIVRNKSYKIKDTLKEHTFGIYSMVKLPNYSFASGSGDKTIKIWNSEYEVEKTLRGHNSTVSCLCLMQNKIHLASASSDKFIKIWDFENGECIFTFKAHEEGIAALICLYDGRLVSSASDNMVKIWDNENKFNCTHILKGHSAVINALLNIDDHTILSASEDKIMKIWEEER
ncbi:MAG: WD40 repeat domain-containing protein, partial [archaeon]|nr:WD40 repeat domain-containing protein [archaeon]